MVSAPMSRHRTGLTPGLQGRTTKRRNYSSGTVQDLSVDIDLRGDREMYDSLHGWTYRGRFLGDIGGPAVSVVRDVVSASPRIDYKVYPGGVFSSVEFSGPVHAASASAGAIYFYDMATPTTQELITLGTTAISRSAPNNPVADLSVFLGELRADGIPRAIGSSSWKNRIDDVRRNAGEEYLNYQFGWLPFVRDIRAMAHAVVKSDSILREYRKGSGKKIHRTYTFPVVTSEPVRKVLNVPFTPAPFNGMVVGPSSRPREQVVRMRTESRFRGCFTYYLDVSDNMVGQFARHASEARKLLGVRLTPDVAWNLAPWSWAADWISNMGDVQKNVSLFQQDGLTMHYGYMTKHASSTNSYRFLEPFTLWDGRKISPSQTFRVRTWRRVAASPYGFGLSFDSLTPRQVAIVAALGFTRGGRGQ